MPYADKDKRNAYLRQRRVDPSVRASRADADARWRAKYPERRQYINRAYSLRRKYGLSVADYERMLGDQNGACAICGVAHGSPDVGVLVVDHMHCSGRVRALLCRKCNGGLGMLRDNPDLLDAAASYVRKHAAH